MNGLEVFLVDSTLPAWTVASTGTFSLNAGKKPEKLPLIPGCFSADPKNDIRMTKQNDVSQVDRLCMCRA